MYRTTDEELKLILTSAKVIAIVGLSPKQDRPSYGVARYLQQQGYRIVPVNPLLKGGPVLGEVSYLTLEEAHQALSREGKKIDIVDVFRKSAEVPEVVTEAIHLNERCLWLQLGVQNESAEIIANAAGLDVVSNYCIKIEHARLLGSATR